MFALKIKEQQFADAINAALGVEFEAIAQVPGPLVPGQHPTVVVSLTNRAPVPIGDLSIELVADPKWEATGFAVGDISLGANQTRRQSLTLAVPPDAPPTRPYFARASLADSRYRILDAEQQFKPFADPPVAARARYSVDNVAVDVRTIVRRREPHLPFGESLRELAVVPAVAVNVTPRTAIVPTAAPRRAVDVRVELVNNLEHGGRGR